jgi:adenylate cyclase
VIASPFQVIRLKMTSYTIQVFNSGELARTFALEQTIVVGRRDTKRAEPAPLVLVTGADSYKLVIADQTSVTIPRTWFEVSVSQSGTITITNLHGAVALPIECDNSLAAGACRTFDTITTVIIDTGTTLKIEATPDTDSDGSEDGFRSLHSLPPALGSDILSSDLVKISQLEDKDPSQIVKMLRLALQVVQKAAGSDAFYQSAVAATIEIIDLDRAVLLLRDREDVTATLNFSVDRLEGWTCVATITQNREQNKGSGSISQSLLARVLKQRVTVVHDPMRAIAAPGKHANISPSLKNVECAVASPIMNEAREIIGVLYGDRLRGISASGYSGIDDFEATLVELLAGTIAGGIAKRNEERRRITLSEFFSPKVANLLATSPELMEGNDAEVSVLFCDIRGFSTVTEQLGPRKAIAWINDVMTELSACVLESDGVLVDYVGDELFAMWGAPGEQPNHAQLALETAQAMLQKIEDLRVKWADTLPQKFGAGIGVNTGPARVGNVGSRQKFKYGPIGNTVNFGSRIQSATKQLGVSCIATGETLRAAGQLANWRRLAKLCVVGIDAPVDVYEIVLDDSNEWRSMTQRYHMALEHFEQQRFHEAARTIGALLPEHPTDLPCRKLLARVLIEMDEPTVGFNGLWKLTIK